MTSSGATRTMRSQRVEPLPLSGAEQQALREVWGQTLVELAADYPELVVLDGDLANSTRADIFAAAVPDRFFEMGIAEQNMVGVAAGMATLGFVPWLSTFAAFMANRATDQVRIVVAQPHLNVKMSGGYTGILTGKTGKTHQSVEDIAIFRAMPGVVTLAPADGVELRSAMRAMMETPGPMYLRVTRDPWPVIFPDDYTFQIGPGVLLRDGDAIVALAERTGRIVTAEDHSIIGGLGSAVAEVLGERRPTPIRRIGLRDVYGESAPNDYLLEAYGISAGHVAAAAREMIQEV